MVTLVGLFQVELKARGRVLSLHRASKEGRGGGGGRGVQPRPQGRPSETCKTADFPGNVNSICKGSEAGRVVDLGMTKGRHTEV